MQFKKSLSALLLLIFAWMQMSAAFATVIVTDASPGLCDFRCTLVSGQAVADGSSSGNGTMYGDNYLGNQVALYDGIAHWKPYVLVSEIGYVFTGITAGTMYDLYIYWNGTAIQFDTPVAWTNSSTPPSRTIVNGVICKGGATTRRLACSFYATGTNLTMDWPGARCVSNQSKRVPRAIYCVDASGYSYLGGWAPGDGATNTVAWLGQEFFWMASSDGTNVCSASDSQGILLTGSYCTAFTALGFSGQTTLQGSIVTGNTAVCEAAVFASQLTPGWNSCCHYVMVDYNSASFFPVIIQGSVNN